jgi:hypothetical protein
MDFGIVTAKIDEIGYITHAENLGYNHCWVTDSQMLREQQGLHQIMLYLPLNRKHWVIEDFAEQVMARL